VCVRRDILNTTLLVYTMLIPTWRLTITGYRMKIKPASFLVVVMGKGA